jgi:hypothetical protein
MAPLDRIVVREPDVKLGKGSLRVGANAVENDSHSSWCVEASYPRPASFDQVHVHGPVYLRPAAVTRGLLYLSE